MRDQGRTPSTFVFYQFVIICLELIFKIFITIIIIVIVIIIIVVIVIIIIFTFLLQKNKETHELYPRLSLLVCLHEVDRQATNIFFSIQTTRYSRGKDFSEDFRRVNFYRHINHLLHRMLVSARSRNVSLTYLN